MTEKILVDPAYNMFNAQHQSYHVTNPPENTPLPATQGGIKKMKKYFGIAVLAASIYFGIDQAVPQIFPDKPDGYQKLESGKNTYEKLENRVTFGTEVDGKVELMIERGAEKFIQEGNLHKQMGQRPMNVYELYRTYTEDIDSDKNRKITEEEAKKYCDKEREKAFNP